MALVASGCGDDILMPEGQLATEGVVENTEPSLGLTDSWPAPEKAATPVETEPERKQGSTAGSNLPATQPGSTSSAVTSASSSALGTTTTTSALDTASVSSASSSASGASTSKGSSSVSATLSSFTATSTATSTASASTGTGTSDGSASSGDASADSKTSSTGTDGTTGTTAGAETGSTGAGSEGTSSDGTSSDETSSDETSSDETGSETGTDSTSTSTDDTGADGPCGSIPFDEAWLRQKLSELTGAVETTLMGAPKRLGQRYTIPERFDARAWLAQEYAKFGYTLRAHSYSTGVNAFAERKGTGDGVLVISAHLDTREGTPGADDDGTGIITGLAMAAAFARCQPEKTVRFMAFDEEEQGTRGSYAYIASLKQEQRLDEIEGLIQVEMTGYDNNNDGGLAKVDCGNEANRALSNALESAIQTHSIDLKTTSYCARGSDHAPFWDSEVPAMTVSQLFFRPRASTNDPAADRNPCYHSACDTVDKLNFEYMNKVARALTYTAIDLSGAK